MLKYATAEILGAHVAERPGESLMRTAHRVAFNYTPRPGYLYVRSRMISSRTNDNFDEFPADEIDKGYHTFIGKPVFVNHHNEDHRRARGMILDVALHKDANRDGSPDTWVEGLQEIDALTYPKLARAIVRKEIARTSMGVDVAFSVCSACNNRASSPVEYCKHIPAQKGAKFLRRVAGGEPRPTLIRERCHGLSFFENSLLVEDPADPTAFFLGDVERGPGLEHLGAFQIPHEATRRYEPEIVHRAQAQQHIARTASRSPVNAPAQPRTAGLHFEGAGHCPGCGSTNTIKLVGSTLVDCFTCEGHYDLQRVARTEPPPSARPIKYPVRPVPGSDDDGDGGMDDAQKAKWAADKQKHVASWHKANPPRVANIVDHWHAATDSEKEHGLNWYADAHHATRLLAEGTGTEMHTAAGLVSNYSPQTHWATNITTAARVMRTKQPLGGKGNKDGLPAYNSRSGQVEPRGIMASQSQKDKAGQMLQGAHYNQLFSGPKTRAFAHLIEHGDDTDEDKAAGTPKVVVDRHAMSVACGARATDLAYGGSGLGGKKTYAHFSGLYHQAAKQISQHEGYEVHPHQVQAATWLVRQRLNEEHDRRLGMNGSRSATAAQSAIHQMNSYMGEHHPEMSTAMPGTGYSRRDTPTDLEKLHYEDHAEPPGQQRPHQASRGRRGRR